jgi:hypothetical protein
MRHRKGSNLNTLTSTTISKNNTLQFKNYFRSSFLLLMMFIVVALSILISAIYFAYKYELNDIDSLSKINEATESQIRLSGMNGGDKINDFIQNAKIHDARILFDEITSMLNGDIKKYSNLDFSGLSKLEVEIQNNFTAILSAADIVRLLDVISDKVDSFNAFVTSNNWKTLSQVSNRLKIKLDSNNSKRNYTSNKLDLLYKSINSDLDFMTEVTQKSVLSEQDKIIIISKIKGLTTELELLKQYSSGSATLLVSLSKYIPLQKEML